MEKKRAGRRPSSNGLRPIPNPNLESERVRSGAVVYSLETHTRAVQAVGPFYAATLALLRALCWRTRDHKRGLIPEHFARDYLSAHFDTAPRAWRKQRDKLISAGLLAWEEGQQGHDGGRVLRVLDYRRGWMLPEATEGDRRVLDELDAARSKADELAKENAQLRAELDRVRTPTRSARTPDRHLRTPDRHLSNTQHEATKELKRPNILVEIEDEIDTTYQVPTSQGDGPAGGVVGGASHAEGGGERRRSYRALANVEDRELSNAGAMLRRLELAVAEGLMQSGERDRLEWLTMAVHARAGRVPGALFRATVLRRVERLAFVSQNPDKAIPGRLADPCTAADEDEAVRWLKTHERPDSIRPTERAYHPDPERATFDSEPQAMGTIAASIGQAAGMPVAVAMPAEPEQPDPLDADRRRLRDIEAELPIVTKLSEQHGDTEPGFVDQLAALMAEFFELENRVCRSEPEAAAA